jgi:hypothetical protein
MSRNAESGPSRLRGLSISGSSSSSASPINAIDDLDDLKDYGHDLGHMGHIQPHQYASGQYAHISPHQLQQQGSGQMGQAHTQGQGQAGQGINRNGLRVAEDGEVTRVPAFLTKLFRCVAFWLFTMIANASMQGELISSMVSDAETDKLIYWSPNGDSFLSELAPALKALSSRVGLTSSPQPRTVQPEYTAALLQAQEFFQLCSTAKHVCFS